MNEITQILMQHHWNISRKHTETGGQMHVLVNIKYNIQNNMMQRVFSYN